MNHYLNFYAKDKQLHNFFGINLRVKKEKTALQKNSKTSNWNRNLNISITQYLKSIP